MIDIVYLVVGQETWQSKKRFSELKNRYPFIQRVQAESSIKAHYAAVDEINTPFFYVVDSDFEVSKMFKFDTVPYKNESAWVTRFKNANGTFEKGVRIMHSSMFEKSIEEVQTVHGDQVDFIYDFGGIGTKDVDIVATNDQQILPDIVFIDLDESFADAHYQKLKDRFGDRVHRSSGVKGLWSAHKEASNKSTTDLFYVVDSDVIIRPEFNLDFVPEPWDECYVHVWNSHCPLTGLTYGNGGVKLFNKSFFGIGPNSYVDMTIWIAAKTAAGAKYHDAVAAENLFYEDQYLAWRGAFREAAKLQAGSVALEGSDEQVNLKRLNSWLNIGSPHPNAPAAMQGAEDGVSHIKKGGDLALINNYEWLRKQFGGVKRVSLQNEQLNASFVYNVVGLLYAKDHYGIEDNEVRDALSKGQLLSKLWLANTFNSVLHERDIRSKQKMLVVGGWIGTLSNILFQQSTVELEIVSLDLNPVCAEAAKKVNTEYLGQFNAITGDMYDYKKYGDHTVVINTSCEHISDLRSWVDLIPSGTCVILQSNDYDEIEEHVNCVKNIDEFVQKAGLKKIFYSGEKNLNVYTRYMLIGEV